MVVQQTRQDVRVGECRGRRSQQKIVLGDQSRQLGRSVARSIVDLQHPHQTLVGASVVIEFDGHSEQPGPSPGVAGDEFDHSLLLGLDVPDQQQDRLVQVFFEEAGEINVVVFLALLQFGAASHEHQVVGPDNEIEKTHQSGFGSRRIWLDTKDAISERIDSIELLGVIVFLLLVVIASVFAAGRVSHFDAIVCLFSYNYLY